MYVCTVAPQTRTQSRSCLSYMPSLRPLSSAKRVRFARKIQRESLVRSPFRVGHACAWQPHAFKLGFFRHDARPHPCCVLGGVRASLASLAPARIQPQGRVGLAVCVCVLVSSCLMYAARGVCPVARAGR